MLNFFIRQITSRVFRPQIVIYNFGTDAASSTDIFKLTFATTSHYKILFFAQFYQQFIVITVPYLAELLFFYIPQRYVLPELAWVYIA